MSDRVKGALYHTPLSKTLVENAEKLGNFLHAKNIFRTKKEKWYNETKEFFRIQPI